MMGTLRIETENDMKTLVLVLTLCLALKSSALAQADGAGVDQEILARVKGRMLSDVAKGKVAGAAHLISHNGREVYFASAGLRDIETQKPLERDTILRFYSMSKPITSVAAMKLYEQGKFQLEDPVSKFIPAFRSTTVWEEGESNGAAVAAEREIQILDVFRHTTGFAYGGNGNSTLDAKYASAGMKYRPPGGMMPPDMTIENAANALASIPAHHHPGKQFTYGFSTDLLGRLIEVWSGKTLDEYLKSAIFDPCNMTDTDFYVPEGKRERFATCHTWRDGKLGVLDKYETSPFASGFKFLSGGGGLLSTIEDYSHFCQMLVNDGKYNGTVVIQPDTLELMFEDRLQGIAGPFKFGLGFAIQDVEMGQGSSKRTVKQYHWAGYASTDFKLVPSEKTFQIFVRQRVPSDHKLASDLIFEAYKAL